MDRPASHYDHLIEPSEVGVSITLHSEDCVKYFKLFLPNCSGNCTQSPMVFETKESALSFLRVTDRRQKNAEIIVDNLYKRLKSESASNDSPSERGRNTDYKRYALGEE